MIRVVLPLIGEYSIMKCEYFRSVPCFDDELEHGSLLCIAALSKAQSEIADRGGGGLDALPDPAKGLPNVKYAWLRNT